MVDKILETGINFLLIIVALITVYMVISAFKRGIVRELISLITLIVLCAVLVLIANGVGNYQDGNMLNVIAAAVLLVLLIVAHHFIGVVFLPAKIVSKLPGVHIVDKVLGAFFGFLEVVLLLWTVYTLVMMLNMGAPGKLILSFTNDSTILSWFYTHNYLAYLVEKVLSTFDFVSLEELMLKLKY